MNGKVMETNPLLMHKAEREKRKRMDGWIRDRALGNGGQGFTQMKRG